MAKRLTAPERRRQLLEVAVTVFAEKGLRSATTAELARAAGVGEPILYRHFPDKHRLFIAALHESARALLRSLEAAADESRDPGRRFELLLLALAGSHAGERSGWKVIAEACMEGQSDPRVRRAVNRHLSALRSLLEREALRAQQAGAARIDARMKSLCALIIDAQLGAAISGNAGAARAHADRIAALRSILIQDS